MILSIDPGSVCLGYAIFKDTNLLECSSSAIGKSQDKIHRIAQQTSFVQSLIKEYSPKILVIEEYFAFQRMRGSDVVPALRGTIMLTAYNHKVEVVEISPTHVKKFCTGNGNANKDMIEQWARITYNITCALPQDVFDAVAIGHTFVHGGEKPEKSTPKQKK